MDDEQRKIYAYFAEKARRCYEEVRNSGGNPRNNGGQLAIFANLLRLRQICCNPSLLPEDLRQEYVKNTGNSLQTENSSKMELLQELLQESIDSGHKVLIFSQFTTMLKSIAMTLEQLNIPYEYLDGSTKDRMDRVDSFNQSREIPVFLLSLKAGGVGLNLTAADTVIIYDPWWNPAAEAQAVDRIHRIGQTRNVNSIKLVMKDSVEEKVLDLQSRKKELFDSLVEEPGSSLGNMTLEDFEFLLKN